MGALKSDEPSPCEQRRDRSENNILRKAGEWLILRKAKVNQIRPMVIMAESVCSKYIGQLARKGLTEKRLEKGQVKLCQSWERHGWNQKEGGYRSTWVSLVGPRRTLPISGWKDC